MKRHLICATVLTGGLALILATVASGNRQVVQAGDLYLADNGGISPLKLPRHGTAPITARIVGEIGTVDSSHPPALRSVAIDVDKTLGIDTAGLPACKAGQIAASSTAAAKQACGGAIVGSGEAEVEVAFPEQEPFSSTGPLVLFNGGVHGGVTTVLLHAYLDVPAPTAVVVRATVARVHRGRFGLRILARVPKIAGGAGSVTKFKLKIGRRFTYKGRKRSFLVASCPTGHWVTSGTVLFEDETKLSVTHVFPCTPSG